MSGETESNVSGWTVDTLHTHFARQIATLRDEIERTAAADRRAIDQAFKLHADMHRMTTAASEKAVAAALSAQKEAVTVQAETLQQRADIQNEWRASLNDVLTRAMPRIEAEAIIARATDRIQELVTAQQLMVSRPEMDAIRERATERLNDLTTRVTRAESSAQGAQGNRVGVYQALSAAVALIAILVFLANIITR